MPTSYWVRYILKCFRMKYLPISFHTLLFFYRFHGSLVISTSHRSLGLLAYFLVYTCILTFGRVFLFWEIPTELCFFFNFQFSIFTTTHTSASLFFFVFLCFCVFVFFQSSQRKTTIFPTSQLPNCRHSRLNQSQSYVCEFSQSLTHSHTPALYTEI